MTTSLSRQYVKLCDVRDFSDPAILAAIASILPERDARTHVERKVWEFAMLALFMEEVGRLGEHTEALSVGAGDERILYWLANRIGRVVATDVYGQGAFAGNEAKPSMLEDPGAHAPFAYREDRLEVMWMDARALAFPDATFDVVFTLSSIEHFGGPRDVRRAAAEIGRVLKPGGQAIVVTDCFVRLHPFDRLPLGMARRLLMPDRGRRGAASIRRGRVSELFTSRELARRIVRPSGLRLLQPLDRRLSPESWENVSVRAADGSLLSATGGRYPMILVPAGRSVFTSVCLVMEKPR